MTKAEIGLFEQVFTHVEGETQTTWASARLAKYCEEHAPPEWTFKIPVEKFHAEYCMTERGVETPRLERLLNHPQRMCQPILFVGMPDGRTLLLDGTHRYVLAYLANVPQLLGWIVPYDVAKDYIVTDADPIPVTTLMTMWSGF